MSRRRFSSTISSRAASRSFFPLANQAKTNCCFLSSIQRYPLSQNCAGQGANHRRICVPLRASQNDYIFRKVNIAYEPPRRDGPLIVGLGGFRHDDEKIEVTVSSSFATGMRT